VAEVSERRDRKVAPLVSVGARDRVPIANRRAPSRSCEPRVLAELRHWES